MTRHTHILMSVVYWAFVVYVFVPLVLMVLMGFKDSKFIGFPIRGWTLKWYAGVFQDACVDRLVVRGGVRIGYEDRGLA